MADDNVVQMRDGGAGNVLWADSFINLLAGLGVPGRDKFASQTYSHVPLSSVDLENAYRSDWIARKVVTIPAWDMTREWRNWQADPDQIELLETTEKKLFIQQKLQSALIKARLYGGAAIIIGVDAGSPEEELDLEMVYQDALKFIHVVSKNNIRAGPIIHDISSKYFGQPEFYEARQEPVGKDFKQAEVDPSAKNYAKTQIKVHPSRVIKLIGMDTADQMLQDIWGDSVLQAVNDQVKMCGLVTGSLATLISELKIDVIKVPELKSILSTDTGTRKMLGRFSAANVAKSTVNTILIDGNEEWQRVQASLVGVSDVMMAYMQIAAGACDIPATRFLGSAPKGLNATGESDIRNYYDRLAGEQTTQLTPTMTPLDEVLIRSALGERPPEVWYEWRPLWQLSVTEKADIALKKAQTYQIDVNAAQIPTTALANARVNQLIEDGFYPGLEQAMDDAAIEGDTIEEQNAPAPMDPAMLEQQGLPPPGQPGGPPAGNGGNGSNVVQLNVKPRDAALANLIQAFEDYNKCHNEHGEEGGQFCSDPDNSGQGGKETGRSGEPEKGETHEGSRDPLGEGETARKKRLAREKEEKKKKAAEARAAKAAAKGAKSKKAKVTPTGRKGAAGKGLGALGKPQKGEKGAAKGGAGKGEGGKGGPKASNVPSSRKEPKAAKTAKPTKQPKEKAGKKGPAFKSQVKTPKPKKGSEGGGKGKGKGKKGEKGKKGGKGGGKPKAPKQAKQPKQQQPKAASAKKAATAKKAAAKKAQQIANVERAISEATNPEVRRRLELLLQRLKNG